MTAQTKTNGLQDEFQWQLDHVAFAVRSTDDAMALFRMIYPRILLYKGELPHQKVMITYLAKSESKADTKIELVEGIGENNPVANLIRDEDCVQYHIGFSVPDFDDSLSVLKQKGFHMASKPFVPNFNPKLKACHLYHEQAGIIEILGDAYHPGRSP